MKSAPDVDQQPVVNVTIVTPNDLQMRGNSYCVNVRVAACESPFSLLSLRSLVSDSSAWLAL
eukprot:CAMPEP_0197066518 /NCGR_PEP_ID=MMETSP1384-20130603/174174_1 /TAXON_ID=29189 /ORGANISM="Ammonia sp." /LENGTH=61 /DNA_ID=CAMNT_0042503691 /DNA_START=114 /DNA_END=295 /DNA_ORIENTATION=-